MRLDALRGLLLLIMAAVHIPTPLSHIFQEPFGYISAAEGFIFLSACLAGRIYGKIYHQNDWNTMARRIWKRARLIYFVHLGLLIPMALLAWATAGRLPALSNHFHDFLLHPMAGLALIPLLLQQPPLFDILPLYVILLGTTPWLLRLAKHQGWKKIMFVSGLGWLAAQGHFLPTSFHSALAPVHLGSFNLLAWQFLWICGLALGESSLRGSPITGTGRVPIGIIASIIVLVGLLSRHGFWPAEWFNPSLYLWMDKWTLGPLRLLNFAAWVTVLLVWKPRLPDYLLSPTALLWRNSLAVFSFHLLLSVAATVMIQLFALASGERILIGLAVMALLFAWAAWLEYRKTWTAKTLVIRDPFTLPPPIEAAS